MRLRRPNQVGTLIRPSYMVGPITMSPKLDGQLYMWLVHQTEH